MLRYRNESQELKNHFFNIYPAENTDYSHTTTNTINKEYLPHRFFTKLDNYKSPKVKFKKFHLNDISFRLKKKEENSNPNSTNLPDINNSNNERYQSEVTTAPIYNKIIDPKYKRIYIKKKDITRESNNNNYIYNNNQYLRLAKSLSDVKVNESSNENNYNPFKLVYYGRGMTDITNDELFDKYIAGNNGEFLEYKDKYKEISLYNKLLVENKNKQKKIIKNYNILSERSKIKNENDYYNKLAINSKLSLKESQRKYKNSLDNQLSHIIEYKLSNEKLPYQEFIKNRAYERQQMVTPVREFLNKNDYVDVNPYNNKQIYLGESRLENNTILNPRIQFKINKYLFPKIMNGKNKIGIYRNKYK